jgi:hypothetical protein
MGPSLTRTKTHSHTHARSRQVSSAKGLVSENTRLKVELERLHHDFGGLQMRLVKAQAEATEANTRMALAEESTKEARGAIEGATACCALTIAS